MLEKWISYNGKDPTKVDRSAAYAARYVAKNLVAAGIAHRCEIQIAYAIGVANPVSVSVNTFGTGVIQEEQILKLIDEFFDLRPLSIINGLGLRKPIYKPTASYGHFGRKDLQLPCEINSDHPTFIRKNSGKNYTEPHHLVPMAFSEQFNVSLDVEENIVSLCSNCHNQIHYGADADKLIEKLYEERKDALASVGIIITLEQLLSMYGY